MTARDAFVQWAHPYVVCAALAVCGVALCAAVLVVILLIRSKRVDR